MSLATRYVEGGRQRVLEYINYAALNGVEHAVKFWHVYADLSPWQRSRVSLDDVCWAAGVKPDELMGVIVSTAMKNSIEVASLVAAAMHPDIVKQAARSAKRIGGRYAEIGFKDRLLMLQSQGFAPLPKGQGTSVHVHANASANAEAAAASKSDSSVPTFADDMDVIGSAVLGAHRLPTGRQNTLEADFAAGDELRLPDLETAPVRR